MRILVKLLVVLLILAGAGCVGLYLGYRHYAADLPDYHQLVDYQPPTATRVQAGDGRLIAEFAAERRVFVPISLIPKRVRQAFVSAEDQNFYQHGGVDWLAIARAMATNVERVGQDRRPIGASTITQQVTRLFLLNNEVSYVRKIKEAILSYRIEDALSKDRILELYLNEIFLGNRSFGVAAAALNYFNKSLDELTVDEAAFLASLPKAPDRYYRDRFHDAAIARRNYVLGRMAEDGYITAAEAKEAQARPLTFRDRHSEGQVDADYFVEEVRRELLSVYGESKLYEGGLSIRTTLDPKLQQAAVEALRHGLEAFDRRKGWRGPVAHLDGPANWQDQLAKATLPAGGERWQLAVVLKADGEEATIGLKGGSQGKLLPADVRWAKRAAALATGDLIMVDAAMSEAKPASKGQKAEEPAPIPGVYALRQIPELQGAVVAMDPRTGRVLAMSGGFSARISAFNRATQANRQPGSAFKPFVYLAALDRGFTPSSLVLDAPFSLEQGAGQEKWRPSNYTDQFYGPTPLRVGIEKSRNVMTVRLAQNIGMPAVVEEAKLFGISDHLAPELSMALGAGETTVLKLATAYAMLDNGGKRITPTFVDRVQDASGKTIYRHDQRACEGCQLTPGSVAPTADVGAVPDVPDTREQIEDPRTVYQIVNILQGVVDRGTAASLRVLGKTLAGKTGTTNDSQDAWFMGFSPDLVFGVFTGYDQPRSLGDHETGASVAVPIFKEFMETALADKPSLPFRVPPGVRLVRVNPETGRLAEPGDRKAIWEAFIPGTEPKGGEGVLDGGDSGSVWVQATPAAQQQSTQMGTGTGTVY
ncbi:penicillin-binding protein 1A [Nitrospirillum sp. BR 11163]|uniref:penicillin-binding protein 1A n=1 Tax=Nitrospirillum sp. BR 11163 TaxID=3104323 RepID=UPI002AFFFC50|nr:penicillin-binding protein 1A [Nitrospirillum sp. BR 11163]MEA1674922.1 penicillin-binding protein 1A [Nitrospirillum sp. BR 11163]